MDFQHKPESVIAAIRKAEGVLAEAAGSLGCARSTIYNYVRRFPEIAAALEDTREDFADYCESKLREHIENGSERSLHFWLTHMARHRGYGRAIKHFGPNGGPIRHAGKTWVEIVREADATAAQTDPASNERATN